MPEKPDECMIEYVTADGLVALEGPLTEPQRPYIDRIVERRLRATEPLPGPTQRRRYAYRSRAERKVPVGNGFAVMLVYRYEEEP